MHNELKELLHSAQGDARHVVVVFLDVRGFSSFAGIAESTDSAEFLKSVYIKILDDYFPEAEFFKPTGDGLLLLYGYDRDTLTAAVRTATDRSIRLVEDFPSICKDDPMINFDVPTRLGVGLARGSATALTAGEKVLDYSGRPLNLGSRLMDLARPSGVVFDGTFGYDLLDEETQARFTAENAYVKGIAEVKPIEVFCLAGYTEIPDFNRRSMDSFVRYSEPSETITLKELGERGPRFRHTLTREPARMDSIEVHLYYPNVRKNGSKHPTTRRVLDLAGEYGRAANKSYATVDYSASISRMKDAGVKPPWELQIIVEYSVESETN